ncbi:MAG: bifunctional phosphoglucose/phosphomannose isomerase [Candidatus Cloacimonadia bacterium]
MIDLDKIDLQKQDSKDMYHKIIHMPEHIDKAYFSPTIHKPSNFDATLKEIEANKIKRVIIVGMGGSAISGDIIQAAFAHLIPVSVYKDYNLPLIESDDLLLVCSYSGNTEETLSCLEQGMQATKYIGAVTCNGLLKQKIDGKYIWCELPTGYPPRSAIAFLFFSLVILLEEYRIIPKQEANIKKAIGTLMIKAGAVAENSPKETNIAKMGAIKINGKIPIVYSTNPEYAPIAYRWKCQINENAKYPAFHHTFPEMNHNEIEAWENQQLSKMFIPIFLSDFKPEYDYAKRASFMKELFEENGVEYLEFFAEGSSYIEKAFSLIYLGDIVSYYLALLQKVDPTDIEYIERLKEKIS